MKPLFKHGPSPSIRLAGVMLLSVLLMTTDQRSAYLVDVRLYLSMLISPLQYLVSLPVSGVQRLSSSFTSRARLQEENTRLGEENFILQARLQLFEDLQRENNRLKGLLGSSSEVRKRVKRVSVAEILKVEVDPFSRKIVINKGSSDGVEEGLPVLDAHGVLGQVIRAGPHASTVMLITDPDHSLPVEVKRTRLRTVAEGMGAVNRLSLLHLPNTAEIRGGDLLVTSGLGDVFPAGYPAGRILEVNLELGRPYAEVTVQPSALLDRNREVLLVWPGRRSKNFISRTEAGSDR
ncbi:MAG: rod shape-determining protein MreC [Gammaproteobacteria bacterium]|nr:rod shape-determining protein MreC [Gammaproteobacteria bacterium]